MPTVVLLALDTEIASALGRIASARADLEIVVELCDAPLPLMIERTRLAHGSAPLGVGTRTELEALEALEHGADEAIAGGRGDLEPLRTLADRTRLRGSLRAASEHARLSLAHTEKLAALGTLVAGVAHEINSPLAALWLSLETLPAQIAGAGEAIDELRHARAEQRGIEPDEVVRIASLAEKFGPTHDISEQIVEMRGAAQAIADVVRDLRVFARADEDEPPQIVLVSDLVDQVLRMVGREIAIQAVIERDDDPSVPEIAVPRSRLAQVLTNVLVNAAHAIREIKRPIHRVRITTRADEDGVAISISDTGPGIPAHALERIFDPFFTTKRASLGTGLGLSISRNLMRRMGGDLIVESVHGVGATFIVLVPPSDEEMLRDARRRSRVIQSPSMRPQRRAVLVVMDDEHLLRAYSRLLARHYDVLLARDSDEAVELVASGSRADAVVTDDLVARAGGDAFFAWLRDRHPRLAESVIVVSDGEPLSPHITAGIAVRTLPKPTPAAALIEAVEATAREAH